MTGHIISEVLATVPKDISPSEKAHIIAATTSVVTFLVGTITFLLGIFRLGFLDAILGRPLLRGFVSAIVSRDYFS